MNKLKVNKLKEQIFNEAVNLHKVWVEMVNFHHPGMFSSNAIEALKARKENRRVIDEYDKAFAQLTASCELYRQANL